MFRNRLACDEFLDPVPQPVAGAQIVIKGGRVCGPQLSFDVVVDAFAFAGA